MNIEQRHATHMEMLPHLRSADLRRHYLVESLFAPDALLLTMSHVERMVIGGALPVSRPVVLAAGSGLTTGAFLESRELGIVNIGGDGNVEVAGRSYLLRTQEGLYVPSGTREVTFTSASSANPARYYLVSTPAHQSHELVHITLDKRMPMPMGGAATSNQRVIYQYVNPAICRSSQLLLGLTTLETGSVWNTMPCHMHGRRSEIYFYFGLPADARVFHFMGEPAETRHIVVANEQAVISPPWSIHTGCGTSNYSFIWAMGGENQDYKDMQSVPISDLR
jgi:4-deoxy-L-threo-5-hexosulose-uronate ketol-isomerase